MLIEQGLYAARSTSSHGGSSPALEMRRLEQRLLFSASAVAPIAAEIAEAGASLMTAIQTQSAGDSGLEASSGLSDNADHRHHSRLQRRTDRHHRRDTFDRGELSQHDHLFAG